MNRNSFLPVLLLVAALVAGAKAVAYEEPPVKQASDIVDEVWLKSEHYIDVEPEVTSDTMLYRHVIKSEYGDFEEYGTDFMKVRVREIHATAGGLTLRILIPGDGLIAAADEGEATRQLSPVYENPPTKLYNENRTLLVDELGIETDRAVEFLGDSIHSPAKQVSSFASSPMLERCGGLRRYSMALMRQPIGMRRSCSVGVLNC